MQPVVTGVTMSVEEKIDRCLQEIQEIRLEQVKTNLILDRNTDELEIHIKRTNLLEKQVARVFMFAILAAGFVAAKYGTDILKIIGVLL